MAELISQDISVPPDRGYEHYLVQSQRALACLVFVVPILIFYEIGIGLIGDQGSRNGIDLWVRNALNVVGAGEILVLPLLTAGTLIFLHHSRRDPCRLRATVLGGMVLESVLLALILLWAAKAHHLLFTTTIPADYTTLIGAKAQLEWTKIVAFLGAGLYEEFLFRLILLTAGIAVFKRLRINGVAATILAVLMTSLLFASLHYDFINPVGSVFTWPAFIVHVVASIFFSLIFLLRGFGVVVGAHVGYDLLTQL